MIIELKKLSIEQASDFWELAFSDSEAEWTKWNGPYFYDVLPSKKEFECSDNEYIENPFRKVIWVEKKMVGMVFAYYEDKPINRWLDIGISIYDHSKWNSGIGTSALKLWVNELFDQVDLPHIGLTTWSGNEGMLRVAEKIGFQKEAQVRKVRYWKGCYWDSIKYGVLRSEWL